jgi:triosephosphate isomerase (TIM)
MYQGITLKPPFFEIGPKNYLFGDQVLSLAKAADEASSRYNVQIIFTIPCTEIRSVVAETAHLLVFAPHMDPLGIGRGLADILPEGIKAAGAVGVMLNHAEKPIHYDVLKRTIERADQVGIATIVCANTITEAQAIALLKPNIIIAEPTELIGTGKTSDMDYVTASIKAIKSINENIFVLQGAGISNGPDVYRVIYAGAEATGSSSGIIKAANSTAMIDEMIHAVREAWDARHKPIY